jgi:hypothetical protein
MPSGKKPVLRTVIAVITVSVIVSCSNETRRSPPVHAVKVSINDANVYMLDNPLGTVALYPGAFYRGMIESKYYMPSLEAWSSALLGFHMGQNCSSPHTSEIISAGQSFSQPASSPNLQGSVTTPKLS